MSELERALLELEQETARRLHAILRDNPFPKEGLSKETFGSMMRIFLMCGVDKTAFATHLGVAPSAIDQWANNRPPPLMSQGTVAKQLQSWLLDMILVS